MPKEPGINSPLYEPSFHIVLHQPEIPPNTGNIIRLCANTGAHLHLIEPLGFSLDETSLRRAGLDYHALTRIVIHTSLDEYRERLGAARIFAFSRHARTYHSQARYQAGDSLLFGPETRGLPAEILGELPPGRQLRIPMCAGNRSLNLSNAVAVACFEAWRQLDYAGASLAPVPG